MPPKSRRIPHRYDDSRSTFSVDTISPNPFSPSEHTSLFPQPLLPTSAPWHHPLLRELLMLLQMTLPIALTYSLQMSFETTSILVVGRISPSTLSTATFAYMFAASTAWLIGLGGTTALDTLCPRIFTSRTADPTELGILLQRAFIILTGFYVVFIIPLWWWSEPVFLLLGQHPELSHQAMVFLRWLIPGGLGYVYFEAAKKFLLVQEIVRASTGVLLVTAPLNVMLNWACIYGLKMGLVGAPVATGVCYWVSFGLVVGYAKWIEGERYWGGWDERCWEYREGVRFARLAFMGLLHVGTEWWAFELTLLLAGRLGPIPLATHSILLTLDHLLSTLPFSLSLTLTTRLGHLLG
ncbi:mate-domain-containing protein, partial [Ascodesmis nigricans]